MKDSKIVRGRGRPKKTIGQTIKKELEINGLFINMQFMKENYAVV